MITCAEADKRVMKSYSEASALADQILLEIDSAIKEHADRGKIDCTFELAQSLYKITGKRSEKFNEVFRPVRAIILVRLKDLGFMVYPVDLGANIKIEWWRS